jgi:hypothetical protein
VSDRYRKVDGFCDAEKNTITNLIGGCMNIARLARLLFSLMIACLLIGFTVSAQDKTPEQPKQEVKSEKAEKVKKQKHPHKGKKAKGTKEKKAEKEVDPQPK